MDNSDDDEDNLDNPPNAPDLDNRDYSEILKDLKNRSFNQGKNLSLLITNLMLLVSSKGDDTAMRKFQILENSLKSVSQSEDFQPVYTKFIVLFPAAGAIMSKNREKESKKRKADEINDKKVFEQDEIDEAILEFVKEIFRLHLLWILWQKTLEMLGHNSSTLATLKDAIPPLLRGVEKCEGALKLLDLQLKRSEEKYESDTREFSNMKESDEYKEMVSKFNELWDHM